MKKQFFLLALSLLVSSNTHAGVSFEDEVLPMFKDRCMKCHRAAYKDPKTGKVKKPKGDFIMESLEHFKAGGEGGPTLVPGKPDESRLYQLITLLPTDDDLMPPKGGKLRNEQIELIKKWIEEGARFGRWVGRRDIATKSTTVKMVSVENSMAFVAARIAMEQAGPTPQMLGDAQLPGVVINPIAKGNPLLRVVVVQQRQLFDDLSLQDMTPIFPFVTELILRKTQISDAALLSIAKMPNLTMLDLSKTNISGSALSALEKLSHLNSLNLYSSSVGPEAIEVLARLKNLKHLYLGASQIDEEHIKRLRSRLPDTDVQGDFSSTL